MASIKRNVLKDGRVTYRFRACVCRNANGKQEFATKTVNAPVGLTPAKERDKMQREADIWEDDLKKGITPVKKQDFAYFVNDVWWKIHVMDGTHTPETISFYRAMSKRIVERFGKKDINSIKPLDIQRFLNDLRTTDRNDTSGKQLSPKTIKHIQRTLTSMFSFAEKHNLVEHSPMGKVESVKLEAHTIDFLSQDEAQAFLTKLAEEPIRWRAMMNVLLRCGLRRGEACGLQWQDISFPDGMMEIKRNVTASQEDRLHVGTTKAKKEYRIPIDAITVRILREWQAEQTKTYGLLMPTAYVFCNETDPFLPTRPDNVNRWLMRFNRKNGFRKCSPHMLRHSCGSLMLMAGSSIKEVADYLRHSDPSTTLRFYSGTNVEMLRTASNRLAMVLGE